MPALNRAWYNLNCARSWPLDERATQVSDAGQMLPDDILADVRLRFPNTAGDVAFVAGVTVSERLASVVLCGAAAIDSVGGFVALGSVTLPQPVDPWRPYPVTPMLPGVGGWVVFGSGATGLTAWSGRFSLPAQSLLMSRTARSYRPPPVTSISRMGSGLRLDGLVRLSGGNDIEIVRECVEIPAYPPPEGQSCDADLAAVRNVVIFRLAARNDAGAQRNVFDIYRGPCGRRPESGTCQDPPPIEFIGPVQPDCCGNVVIEFRGCADLTAIVGEDSIGPDDEPLGSGGLCGAILDCPIKISNTCGEDARLPDESGNLPSDFDDLCQHESSVVGPPTTPPPPPPDPTIEESVSLDEDDNVGSANPDLPFIDDFQIETGYEVVLGEFGYSDAAGDTTYGTDAGAGHGYQNLAIWPADSEAVYRRATAVVSLEPGLTGLLHNAAVVIGFRMVGPKRIWWQAELDWDGYYAGYQALRIVRCDDSRRTLLLDQPLTGVRLDERYRLEATVVPDQDAPGVDAWVKVSLTAEDDEGFPEVVLGWLRLDDYVVAQANFGMATWRAAAKFHLFTLENTTDLGGMA